jgi:hypothetical protein
MTAKERLDRETRRGREVRPEAPADVAEPVVEAPLADDETSSIEFEDRSDEEYRAAVLEVMAALDWVRQQRARGNLPS